MNCQQIVKLFFCMPKPSNEIMSLANYHKHKHI